MRGVAAVLWVLAALGCSEPVGVVPRGDPAAGPPPPSEVRRGPPLYRAILETAREDVVGARVEIVNEGSAAQTLSFPDTCIAMLRAYFASPTARRGTTGTGRPTAGSGSGRSRSHPETPS